MRYSNVNKNKKNGVIYTPIEMADYVAHEMFQYKNGNYDECIEILDPAAGEGKLLVSMIKVVLKLKKPIKVVGYEIDEITSVKTQKMLQGMFPTISIEIRNEDFLTAIENDAVGKFDFVIANPPYIRTQIMGSEKSQKIVEKLKLSGRVDVYYAFLIYAKNVLKEHGVSGYITSNKFMTIKSGSSVRNYMLENYRIHHITDLGDTKLFNASVLPCIIIFSKGKTISNEDVKFTSVYQNFDKQLSYIPISSIFEPIYKTGIFGFQNDKSFKYQQGTLKSIEMDAIWTIVSDENKKWLQNVEKKRWISFRDIGKIRVGIKTTADDVFIGNDWSGENADIELLKPLITHRNSGQIIANKTEQWKVLYTHTVINGKKVAVNIDEFPNSKAYLLKYYDRLSGRKYIKKAKRNWYEIWVPQNPESWNRKKIVFRDISEHPQFWLDDTGAIVNGDCYWIDINDDISEDVIYLALAVANSTFIEKYYDLTFNNKLYSGKRRYQKQYVEQFPLPHYDTEIAKQVITLVKKIIADNNNTLSLDDKIKIDSLVEKMFD